jgi:O-antigen/teichoic acid export membrane protein
LIERVLNRLRNADSDLKKILRGSSVAFCVKILAAGFAFAMNVVISRQLGAEEAGIFFLGYTIVFIAAAIGRLGLDNTFVRFIAAHHSTNQWGLINGIYLTGLRWSLVASLCIAALLWLLAGYLATEVFNKPDFEDVICIMALGIPLMAMFTLHAKALQGIKQIPQSMTVLSVAAPLSLLLLVLLVCPQNSVIAGLLFVVASAFALALGVYWWLQSKSTCTSALSVDRSAILTSCLPLLAVVILIQTVNWSSQIMLGAWGSSADVAVFNAAQRTAMLTSFVLVAVNSIAAPTFAAMYCAEQHDTLRRTALNTTRLMVLFALAPFVLMMVIPNHILLFFGSDFVVGATTLQILAIGQFINVATGSVGFLLSMTGHEKLLRNNVLIAAVTTLALEFTLIPSYSVVGAAVATACGVALQNILGVWQVRRVLGFNTLAIWR